MGGSERPASFFYKSRSSEAKRCGSLRDVGHPGGPNTAAGQSLIELWLGCAVSGLGFRV